MTAPLPHPLRTRLLAYELPLDLALVLLWALVWGSFSPLTLLTGAVIAVATTRLLPLPAVPLTDRVNPLHLLWFLARFGLDVVVASAEVAVSAFRPGQHVSSIIQVRLRTEHDLLMALTSIAVSLVPGSFIVETDPKHRTLLLHVLDTRGPDDVAKARDRVLATETRLIRAIGSRADLARLP